MALVATVLTVYGIETCIPLHDQSWTRFVATVLTVYGIETGDRALRLLAQALEVATVLTVYGIETVKSLAALPTGNSPLRCNSTYRLRY